MEHTSSNTASTDDESLSPSRITTPKLLLRLEGITLLLAAAALYFNAGGSWLLFALLLLAPDISMVGYLGSARLGAAIYNAFHAYPVPALLVALGFWTGNQLLLHVAFVWFAHIGMDRVFGFGLKYPSGFKDTHLQSV